jgi:putative endopeptidase
MNRRALLISAAAATVAGLSSRAEAAPRRGRAVLGRYGLEREAGDPTVRPGDDFFEHVNGAWLKSTEIPTDRVRWGTFDQLRDRADADVRALVEELAARTDAPAGSPEQKIGDFYRAYLDTDAIERAGLAPLQAELAQIAALRDHVEVACLVAAPGVLVNGPIGMGVGLDSANPDRYLVVIGQGGLHLPDREYYLKDDARFGELRTKYVAHVERLLALAGWPEPAAAAAAVFALEAEMAKRHLPVEALRDATRMYNLKSWAEVKALAPSYPWDESLAAAGFGDVQEVVVGPVEAITQLGEHFRSVDLETWKAYFAYALLRNRASVLPKAIDAEVFDFYGRTLDGQPEQRERKKRATQALNAALGDAIGQVYVQRHFSPTAKGLVVELVENLRAAFGQRIDALSWMSAETKAVARQKLATFRLKVGYPDRWRDDAGFEVRAGDALGNARRLTVFEWDRSVARLGRPSDKDEWFMTPQTVNAYYNPLFNEIVFPAAILQPPFFDEHADPAVNYGGIGGVIGHEMGHGFDDQGARYDPHGVLRNWWSERDVAAFEALGGRMVAQYGRFEALPGVPLNGRLTLGENIGDHCGVVMGHLAWQLSLGGRRAPTLEGLTGDQRFFMSWAQIWRSRFRDEALRNHVQTNPHSPGRFRCNGTLQNVDAWYEAFDVSPGDALYVAPADRVYVW